MARGLDPAVVSVAVSLEQVTMAPGFDTALRVELKTSQAGTGMELAGCNRFSLLAYLEPGSHR